MSYLTDSNILSRLSQPKSPHHPIARRAITSLRQSGEEICIVPQNIIEFWAVATRPIIYNGLGLTIDETRFEIRKFKRLFSFYDDAPGIFAEWGNLVFKHQFPARTSTTRGSSPQCWLTASHIFYLSMSKISNAFTKLLLLTRTT